MIPTSIRSSTSVSRARSSTLSSNATASKRPIVGGCLLPQVAAADRPLVGLLQHQGTDEADDGLIVWEDADHVGAALDLLVDPLERVRRRDLGPVLLGVVHVGEDVLARGVHQGAELVVPVAQR